MEYVDAAVLLNINIISDRDSFEGYPTTKVAMVGGKRKSASTVSDEEPSTKLKKTRQGSKMTSKEQRLAMFKRPKPIIPLDDWPLGVLERLVNFLDVVTTISFLFMSSFFVLVLNCW